MQHIVRTLQSVTVDITDYRKKRDFLYDNLTRMGYSVVKPQGAFYMFPKSPTPDDVEFVAELQEYKVLVVPGAGFGPCRATSAYRTAWTIARWKARSQALRRQ